MAGIVVVLGAPGRRLAFALVEWNTKLTATFVVATLLQIRVPTGKNRGPEVGLLLSRPTTFHETGVTVRVGAAYAGSDRNNPARRITRATRRRRVEFMDDPFLELKRF